jgi:hypothetical protein
VKLANNMWDCQKPVELAKNLCDCQPVKLANNLEIGQQPMELANNLWNWSTTCETGHPLVEDVNILWK